MTDVQLFNFLDRYNEINNDIKNSIDKVMNIIRTNNTSKISECYDEIDKIVDLAIEGAIDSKDDIFHDKTQLNALIQKCRWSNDEKDIEYYLLDLDRCSEIAANLIKLYVDPYTPPAEKKEYAELLKKKF